MTVAQLIERLKVHDPESMVLINGDEEGYDEITETLALNIKLNVYDDILRYRGKHEVAPEKEADCRGVVIY